MGGWAEVQLGVVTAVCVRVCVVLAAKDVCYW
jgi:hypothetical protein